MYFEEGDSGSFSFDMVAGFASIDAVVTSRLTTAFGVAILVMPRLIWRENRVVFEVVLSAVENELAMLGFRTVDGPRADVRSFIFQSK